MQSALHYLRYTVAETDRHSAACGNTPTHATAGDSQSHTKTIGNDTPDANTRPRDVSTDTDTRS
jgi:hypothetical protein